MTNAQINSLERRAETAEQQCQDLRAELQQYREQVQPILDYMRTQWPGSIGRNLRQLQKLVDKT
jgi:hypothetical protein